MATKTQPKPPAAKRPAPKMKDLKPKGEIKGGRLPAPDSDTGTNTGNHNETLVSTEA